MKKYIFFALISTFLFACSSSTNEEKGAADSTLLENGNTHFVSTNSKKQLNIENAKQNKTKNKLNQDDRKRPHACLHHPGQEDSCNDLLEEDWHVQPAEKGLPVAHRLFRLGRVQGQEVREEQGDKKGKNKQLQHITIKIKGMGDCRLRRRLH